MTLVAFLSPKSTGPASVGAPTWSSVFKAKRINVSLDYGDIANQIYMRETLTHWVNFDLISWFKMETCNK